eukprot:CAMPEP_0175769250 /NCGR_PEP_ID=MMETSP0097-20121207/70863_1 /TAXON_ID=311494 /ORGANISM="Alexandrium monilatum, Strain CCMP3105" /LENGTH=37 /DNA_ID= /DNA_START= /DNA_END= /DNA_ORIENTATION=
MSEIASEAFGRIFRIFAEATRARLLRMVQAWLPLLSP